MPDEPAAPDLEDRTRQLVEAVSGRDYDAALALFAPEPVWDNTQGGGLRVIEGREAIQDFLGDWIGIYEDFNQDVEEFRDFGDGLTFGVLHQRARPKGSSSFVELRWAAVAEWVEGRIERITTYGDVDEARAAAERLAEKRGQTMSEQYASHDLVELVQRSLDTSNARDIEAQMSLYAPDSVFDNSNVGLGIYEGHQAIRGFLEDWWSTYEDFHIEAEEIRHLGNGIAFGIFVMRGRPLGSTGWVELRYAVVGIWASGLLQRVTNTFDIDEARAAAERLAEERG